MSDKPITREEKYLAYLTGDYAGEIPNPITRKEKYLFSLCKKGIGGAISSEDVENAVKSYLEENPVQPGASTEEAAQINKNTEDISQIQSELKKKANGEGITLSINETGGLRITYDDGE